MTVEQRYIVEMPAADGAPGYIIPKVKIPWDKFKRTKTFWSMSYNALDEDNWLAIKDTPAFRKELQEYLPNYAPTGGGMDTGRWDWVLAWIPKEELEPYIIPAFNEYGEIAP